MYIVFYTGRNKVNFRYPLNYFNEITYIFDIHPKTLLLIDDLIFYKRFLKSRPD